MIFRPKQMYSLIHVILSQVYKCEIIINLLETNEFLGVKPTIAYCINYIWKTLIWQMSPSFGFTFLLHQNHIVHKAEFEENPKADN
jgi:hypothetical protein